MTNLTNIFWLLLFLPISFNTCRAQVVQWTGTRQIVYVTSFPQFVDVFETTPPLFQFFGSRDSADYHISDIANDSGLFLEPWDDSTVIGKALLSTSTSDAVDHLSVQSLPIYNTIGQIVANSASDFWNGNFLAPILDENGNQPPAGTKFWSGSSTGGVYSGDNAGDWSDILVDATFGTVTDSGPSWLDSGEQAAFDVDTRLLGFLPAPGANWTNASGGDFHVASNWSTNQIPGTNDLIAFDIAGATFTTTFSSNSSGRRLVFDDGTVTLDLNGNTFTLSETSQSAPSVTIGRAALSSADVTILDGTLGGEYLTIGGGSTGILRVSTDGFVQMAESISLENGGTLYVQSGGQISNQNGTIGSAPNSTAIATVTGSGSTWAISSGLNVGDAGNGTLNIEAGGQVTSFFGSIGNDPNSIGTVTVTGVGSQWFDMISMAVGEAGNGTLNVEAGGQLSTQGLTIGLSTGSLGTTTVDGADSILNSGGSGTTTVGHLGEGHLTIQNGGVVNSQSDTFIGSESGSQGTVNVDGAGSEWNLDSGLVIGGDFLDPGGTGNVTVSNSGSVTVTSTATTLWNTGTLTIDGGTFTTGSLDNTLGGTLNFDDGTLTIDGGLLDVPSSPFVINGADPNDLPTLELRDGASVALGENWIIGDTNNGAMLVDGAGSSLLLGGSDDDLLIGNDGGDGTLTISGGANVTTMDDATIGRVTGSTGELIIDGVGSMLDVTDVFTASANAGTAVIQINGGGQLSVGDEIRVGQNVGGNGSISLTGGSSLDTPDFYIGGTDTSSGGTGIVSVETSSTMTITNDLTIYNGQLSITGSSTVSNGVGRLGFSSGDNGTATVDGAGSTWTNSQNLVVGNFGDGSLTVTNGGSVTSLGGFIGRESTSTASATVDGTGSSWTMTDRIRIGNTGVGTLDITGGGSVSNLEANVGTDPNSEGNVTVDGTGSVWNIDGILFLGREGKGTLDVTGGGDVNLTSASLLVGNAPGSDGAVTVAGSGSSLSVATALEIGVGGDGDLNIEQGGTVTAASMEASRNDGASADIVVDGSGSSLSITGNMYLGGRAAGPGDVANLTVSNGGSLSSFDAVVGLDTGSTTTVTVDGAGSIWATSSSLVIGDEGNGSVDIQNGGTVTSTFGILGSDSGSNGTVTVDGVGSTWTNSSTLTVGTGSAGGNGSLFIQNGGNVSNLNSTIGNGSGTTGAVSVDGAGSTWTNNGNLVIGNSGNGSLDITNDGAVITVSATVLSGTATLTLDGGTLTTGSFDNTSGGIFNFDDGELIVDGGTFDKGPGNLSLDGLDPNDNPTLVLQSGATSVNISNLNLGNSDQGGVIVKEASTLSSDSARLGAFAGSSGTVDVDGDNSSWNNVGDMRVGVRGNGLLEITSGGTVTTSVGYLGSNTNGVGVVTITDVGSSWNVTTDLFVGNTDSPGSSVLNIGQAALGPQDGTDGLLQVSNTIELYPGNTVNLQGGTLETTTLDNSAGGTFNFTSGILRVDDFLGTLTQDGGRLELLSSPGVLDVSSNFLNNAGTLALEVLGNGGGSPVAGVDFDQLTAATALLVGDLDIVISPGYSPALGDTFRLIDAPGGLTGTFANVTGRYLGDGFSFDVLYDATGVSLQVVTALLGDFDLDGDVDRNDLKDPIVGWEALYGTSLDGSDFLVWQRQLGTGSLSALANATTVPEPCSVALFVTSLLSTLFH